MAELHHAADTAMRASHEAGNYNAQQHTTIAMGLLELETLVTEVLSAIVQLVAGTTEASSHKNPVQQEGEN